MTLRSMFVKCAKCKRTYSWNPDVGKLCCPHCGLAGMSGRNILEQMMLSRGKKGK